MSRVDGTPGDYQIDPPPYDDEPCPFCDGAGVIESESGDHPYRVLIDCDCQGDGRPWPPIHEEPIHDAA